MLAAKNEIFSKLSDSSISIYLIRVHGLLSCVDESMFNDVQEFDVAQLFKLVVGSGY